MKIKYIIKNKYFNTGVGDNHFVCSAEEQMDLVNRITRGDFGRCERWKKETELDEYEELITPIQTRIVNNIREFLLPSDFTVEILDLSSEDELQKQIEESIKIGIESRECCNLIYDYLGGQFANLETSTVDEFIKDHANLMQVLQANRPRALKKLLKNVNPNRILTQGMIDAINHILNKRGY